MSTVYSLETALAVAQEHGSIHAVFSYRHKETGKQLWKVCYRPCDEADMRTSLFVDQGSVERIAIREPTDA